MKTPTIILADRGPTDALIWQFALLAHKGDPNFEIPPVFKSSILECCLHVTAGLQAISVITNAKIIVGIDQEEAQKRRKIAGKTQRGWVTDSPIFGDYSAWTGYWIKNVFPKINFTKGSGLLLVDGGEKIEHKVENMSNYIVEATWRLLPGCY